MHGCSSRAALLEIVSGADEIKAAETNGDKRGGEQPPNSEDVSAKTSERTRAKRNDKLLQAAARRRVQTHQRQTRTADPFPQLKTQEGTRRTDV